VAAEVSRQPQHGADQDAAMLSTPWTRFPKVPPMISSLRLEFKIPNGEEDADLDWVQKRHRMVATTCNCKMDIE